MQPNQNSKEAAIDTSKVKNPAAKEVGASGTRIFSGIISGEEYNPKLVGIRGNKIYEEMRRSDATVRAALLVCKLPILAALWTINPASDDKADQEVADFIERELFHRKIKFNDFLREALTCLDFGYSVFEKVLGMTNFNGKDLVGIEKLGFRKQVSIIRWETEEKQEGITQQLTDKTVSIPMVKLILFTNEKEGDNYEGISILRYAYKHWDYKNKLYKIDAIQKERHGVGVVEIEVPKNADPADEAAAVEAARQMRANEEAYIKHPAGWKVGFMDMMSRTTSDALPSVAHHDRQIVKSVLAQFLELGASDSGGSRALSEDHTKLFELSLEALAKTLQNAIQEFINQLCDLNFTNLPNGYPQLSFGKIGDENVQVMSEAIQKLVSAQVLTPDPEMEKQIRKTMKLPELPEDIEKAYKERSKTTPDESDENGETVKTKEDLDPEDLEDEEELVKKAAAYRQKLIRAADKLYDKNAAQS